MKKLYINLLNYNRQRYIVVKLKKESAGWGSQIYHRQSYPGGLITRRAVSTKVNILHGSRKFKSTPRYLFGLFEFFKPFWI